MKKRIVRIICVVLVTVLTVNASMTSFNKTKEVEAAAAPAIGLWALWALGLVGCSISMNGAGTAVDWGQLEKKYQAERQAALDQYAAIVLANGGQEDPDEDPENEDGEKYMPKHIWDNIGVSDWTLKNICIPMTVEFVAMYSGLLDTKVVDVEKLDISDALKSQLGSFSGVATVTAFRSDYYYNESCFYEPKNLEWFRINTGAETVYVSVHTPSNYGRYQYSSSGSSSSTSFFQSYAPTADCYLYQLEGTDTKRVTIEGVVYEVNTMLHDSSRPILVNNIPSVVIDCTWESILNYLGAKPIVWTTPELQDSWNNDNKAELAEQINMAHQFPEADQEQLQQLLEQLQNALTQNDPNAWPEYWQALQNLPSAVPEPKPDPEPNPKPDPDPDPDNPNSSDPTDSDKVSKSLWFDLKKLFPFCIPFDLIAFITALRAEPEPIKFTLPLKAPRFGIDYEFVIDMSKFNTVAVIFRTCMLAVFLYGLILATRALIKG